MNNAKENITVKQILCGKHVTYRHQGNKVIRISFVYFSPNFIQN